jgi:hypothetical protein
MLNERPIDGLLAGKKLQPGLRAARFRTSNETNALACRAAAGSPVKVQRSTDWGLAGTPSALDSSGSTGRGGTVMRLVRRLDVMAMGIALAFIGAIAFGIL